MDLEQRRKQTATYQSLARLLRLIDMQMIRLFKAVDLKDTTPAQSQVLMVLLEARRPLTARELSRRLSVSEVTMSRFVKSLLAGEWVTRVQSEEDRRAYLLKPTQKVYDHFPQYLAVLSTLLDAGFGHMDDEDLKTLQFYVGTAEERLRALDGPPKII